MPELPEVETVVAGIAPALTGATIGSVVVGHRSILLHGTKRLGARLHGKKIRSVRRHGKRILVGFDDQTVLNIHLGMTGNLLLAPTVSKRAKHTHLIMRFEGLRDELRFVDPRRFGGVWLGQPTSGRFSADLGPDALAVGLREFRKLLTRSRQIKALLLDQQILAGMGNIYCDESLFQARIHPEKKACALLPDQVACLHRTMQKILSDAIRAKGSSIRDYRTSDGGKGGFQAQHRVYGREGAPCRKCKNAIIRIQTASRSTHLCPVCQPR
jgi:formamidopyrimidine-DNA glycosylase